MGVVLQKGKNTIEVPIYTINGDVNDEEIAKLVNKSIREIDIVPIGELNEYNLWISYNLDKSMNEQECKENGYYLWDGMCVTIKRKIIAIIRYNTELEDPYSEDGYRRFVSYDAVVLRRRFS